MNRTTQLATLAALGLAPTLVVTLWISSLHLVVWLALVASISVLGYRWTVYLIPILSPKHQKAGLFGKDINKRGTPQGDIPIPESLGLAPGVVCITCLAFIHMAHATRLVPRICSLVLQQPSSPVSQMEDQWVDDFPAAVASITLMLTLGFVDDVLELPWRVKLVMPLVAAMPLLAAYSGPTAIGIPKPIVAMFELQQTYLELGPIYYVYMLMLVIFCTNAINILAGVNGLEAGQTFLVSCAIMAHNALQLVRMSDEVSVNASGTLFSFHVMMPLAATTLGLLHFNWYPSKVFVGDTFTYFAGMTIATAGILGHQSETLLVFLVPQVLNFLYSVPQLFGWVHCPRHRLPNYHVSSGMLSATANWNLINLFLYVFGPCSELWLCVEVLVFQGITCVLGVLLHVVFHGWWK